MIQKLNIQVHLIGRSLSSGMTPCSVVKRQQHLEEPTCQTTLSYPRTVSALKPQIVYPMQQVMVYGHARKEKVKGSSNVVGVLLNVKAVEICLLYNCYETICSAQSRAPDKGKGIPVTSCGGSQGCEMLGSHIFQTIGSQMVVRL